MDAVEPVLMAIRLCVGTYLSFYAMKDACEAFRRTLIAAAEILQDIQDTLNESSIRHRYTSLGKPMDRLRVAVQSGEFVLKQCSTKRSSSAKKKMLAVLLSRDYTERLQKASDEIRESLSDISCAGVNVNLLTANNVHTIKEQLEELNKMIQAQNHSVSDAVVSEMENGVIKRINQLEDRLQDLGIVKDSTDFQSQIEDLRKNKDAFFNDKTKTYNHILQMVIDLSLKEAQLQSPALVADDETVLLSSIFLSPPSSDHRESLMCPISYEIMEDPVALFPYGKTYDCKNLCRWLLLKPNRDPTGKEFDQPLIFLPNLNLREVLVRDYGEDAYVPYDLTQFYKEYDEAWKRLQQSKNGPVSLPSDTRSNQISKEMFNLACQYRDGTGGKDQDVKNAEHFLKQAAHQGHAVAQNYLGLMYEDGDGVDRDYAEAVRLYRLAANQGLAAAQNNLGRMYKNGDGVDRVIAEAVRWYRLAADQGHAAAQNNLGVMYRDGRGVDHDYAKAVRWYRLAANQGHAAAQNNLGVMYENGHGVDRDYAEAVRLYRLAANQGFAAAQTNLGWMYKNGRGVDRDYAKAVRWYRLAADQGLAVAQNNLVLMYKNGDGVKRGHAGMNEERKKNRRWRFF